MAAPLPRVRTLLGHVVGHPLPHRRQLLEVVHLMRHTIHTIHKIRTVQ